mmetsp:Transcript_30118/g.45917  ORF Transcript_30118/g.45917 Transcript_30118/m.45917 type:complete len:127 (+) Transcript_30118:103-483(+)
MAGDDEKKKTTPSYEERVTDVNIISKPLASKKSTKKLHKLVKKASAQKHIRRGVKEVVKGLRKGDRGLAILAGDIYPVDVVSHLPFFIGRKRCALHFCAIEARPRCGCFHQTAYELCVGKDTKIRL